MTDSVQSKTNIDLEQDRGFGNDWKPISVLALASKELRETLRDRRTIITLFLMPLLVYPILSLLFQGFLASSLQVPETQTQGLNESGATTTDESLEPDELATKGEPSPAGQETVPGHADSDSAFAHPRYVYLFDSAEDFNKLAPALNRGYVLLQERRSLSGQPNPESGPGHLHFNFFHHNFYKIRDADNPDSIRELVESGEGDVGIRLHQTTNPSGRVQPAFELIYRDDLIHSIGAVRLLEGVLDSLNIGAIQQMISRIGRNVVVPVRFSSTSVSTPQPQTGISLTALIPLILTLMTITGAVYPAIDLTAGERERGTLESLVAAPIPRMRILLGKLVAVVAVSMLTAVVNLVGLTVTLWVFQFDTLFFGEQGLTLVPILKILALLVLFAVFFASVLLVITSFARSFKEGQAYLIPVMMVALAPSLMSLKPDLELTGIWAVTPLVNIVLLSRDVLNDTAQWSTALVAIISTVFYSVLAITMAARFFGTAKVLYGEDSGIGTLFRRPQEPTPQASASLAMLCLALLFPASFLWQGLLVRFAGRSTEFMMLLTATGLIVVFFVIPLILAAFHRVRILSGFNLRKASIWCYVAAILLGVGLGPLLMQAIASSGQWLEYIHAGSEASEALIQQAESQAERLRSTPWFLVILCFAITPAVCEEFFFRGLLFRSLRVTLSPAATIIATGVMFGAFHLITASGLGISRLIPTTLMGFALGWLCYKSGSVVPGMILHAINNTMGLSLGYFRDDLVDRGWITESQTYIPLKVLALALILSYAGFAILHLRAGVLGKPDD